MDCYLVLKAYLRLYNFLILDDAYIYAMKWYLFINCQFFYNKHIVRMYKNYSYQEPKHQKVIYKNTMQSTGICM